MRDRRRLGDYDEWFQFDFMNLVWIGMAFVIICIGILLLALSWYVFTGHNLYADDTESDLGLCNRGYKSHCENATLAHDLEGALMIWNSAGCSVRDICTSEKMCFDDEMTKNEYLKSFDKDPNINITVPCPPFTPPHQEDESGK